MPALSAAQTTALLFQLGAAAPERHDRASLSRLQWAFLRFSPFHNLDLLAGTSPRSAEACVAAVLCGAGGPCHVQAVGWLALLRGLGFEAHLAAATIGEPGDHLTCIVHLPEGPVVSDVGNGHPYREAVPLHAPSAQCHLGWRFRGRPEGGHLIWERFVATSGWRVVYRVDPEPRRFVEFLPIIEAHHGAVGFGPFLTGLRAVHLSDDLIVTLRDGMLTRYSAAGARERPVSDVAAAARVLRLTLRLAARPIDAALVALVRRTGGWMAPGPPVRLHLAVSVAATDRPHHLQRLLWQLADAWRTRQEAQASSLTVLVVDNGEQHPVAPVLAATAAAHPEIRWRLDRMPAPRQAIAFSRQQQILGLATIHREHPLDAVWMLDDDLAIEQLELRGTQAAQVLVSTTRNPFDRIVRQRRAQPEASLLVGRVCGDPPSRPEAVLASQLLDAETNLRRFAALEPDAPYPGGAEASLFALPDYYYDHSRDTAHLHQPFLWIARDAAGPTHAEAVACLEALPRAFSGGTPTRPLVHDPDRLIDPEAPYLLRGGNAVFLDIDALFIHPYPTWSGGPVPSRRSDMAGTAWLAARRGYHVAEWSLPVRHDRNLEDVGTSQAAASERVLSSLTSELDGVLVARAMLGAAQHDRARERPQAAPTEEMLPLPPPARTMEEVEALQTFARARVECILQALLLATERVAAVRAAIRDARASWMGRCPRCTRALDLYERALAATEQILLGGTDAGRQSAWRSKLASHLLCPSRLEGLTRFLAAEVDQKIAEWQAKVAGMLGDENAA